MYLSSFYLHEFGTSYLRPIFYLSTWARFFPNSWVLLTILKMANSDRVPNEVKSFLRSVLVSSKGVKESRVQNDYRELIGEKLMWRNYGFNSLNEFLKAIPDVCTLEYNSKDKENRVYAVHIDGIFMSSHAKKNVKEIAPDKTPAKQLEDGRFIQTDGEMGLKITLTNNNVDARKAGHFEDGIQPNKNGKYQVYVTMLPESCTKVLKFCSKFVLEA